MRSVYLQADGDQVVSKRSPLRCPECIASRPCPCLPPCQKVGGSWTFSGEAPKTREEERADIERRTQAEIDARQARSRK